MKEFLVKLVREGKLKLDEASENICRSYLNKSFSNFESAQILIDNDKLEEAVGLIYYSMYNLVLGLLFRVGIKSKNHSASIFLLKEIFNFDNELIDEAKRDRIDKQYYVGFDIFRKEILESLKNAEDFNRELRSFVLSLGERDVVDYREKFRRLVG